MRPGRRAIDESDEIDHLGFDRRLPRERDVAVRPDGDPVAFDHLAVVGNEVGNGAAAMGVRRGDFHHPFLDLMCTALVGDVRLALAIFQDPGKHLAEQLGRGAAFKRDMPRAIMVAREQPP